MSHPEQDSHFLCVSGIASEGDFQAGTIPRSRVRSQNTLGPPPGDTASLLPEKLRSSVRMTPPSVLNSLWEQRDLGRHASVKFP